MTSIPVRIRRGSAIAADPKAWFIAGSSPRGWIDEMVRWDVPFADLRLLVIPRSSEDRRALGALVMGVRRQPAVVGRARPYVAYADRLFHPADAVLEPPMTDAEIGASVVHDHAVLHPSTGLVGYSDADVMRVEDLLVPLEASGSRWCDADPGIVIGRRLLSVEPQNPPTVESVLGEGREDIGESAPGELPPTTRERDAERRAFTDSFSRGFARAVHWLASKAPGGAESPTWINRVQDWAADRMGGFAERLELRRNREIHRLLDMLERDPDQGLKFAIPIGGEGGRGIADPGARLGERDVDFDLRGLGGGGPVDAWDLPWQLQARLEERYREAANREIRLGNHRRAAYIFAQLLNDLPAAARTLRDGGHYREAAVLYRDRLDQPVEAAECLEGGGLLTEAARMFAKHGRYEKAGDLYRQVDQEDAARDEYRQAVRLLDESGDLVAAARVLESKLNSPDEALETLSSGWPRAPQAHECLVQYMALLGRLGRHDRAKRTIGSLQEKASRKELVKLARVLPAVVTSYPDLDVRHRAADTARVLAGNLLVDAEAPEGRSLLQVVRELAPDDRLLHRDTRRFAGRLPTPISRPIPVGSRQPVFSMGLDVPTIDGEWQAAGATADTIVLAGVNLQFELILAGSRWSHPLASSRVRTSVGDCRVVDPPHRSTAEWHWIGSTGRSALVITFRYRGPGFERFVHSLPDDAVGVAADDRGRLRLARWSDGGLVLQLQKEDGGLLQTARVNLPFVPEPEDALSMVANAAGVFVAIGQLLVHVSPEGETDILDLDQPIRSLAVTPPHTAPRILVGLPSGVRVLGFGGVGGNTTHDLAKHVDDPVLGLSSSGHIVVSGTQEAEVYRTHGAEIRHVATFRVTGGRPFAVVRGPKNDQVALVSRERVTVMAL